MSASARAAAPAGDSVQRRGEPSGAFGDAPPHFGAIAAAMRNGTSSGRIILRLPDRLELQANVYNLLNRYYIDLPHPSHLVPGAGASALIGVNFKF